MWICISQWRYLPLFPSFGDKLQSFSNISEKSLNSPARNNWEAFLFVTSLLQTFFSGSPSFFFKYLSLHNASFQSLHIFILKVIILNFYLSSKFFTTKWELCSWVLALFHLCLCARLQAWQSVNLGELQLRHNPPACLQWKSLSKKLTSLLFLDIHDSLIVNAIGIRSCGDNVTALFCGGGFCDIGRCGYTIHYNIVYTIVYILPTISEQYIVYCRLYRSVSYSVICIVAKGGSVTSRFCCKLNSFYLLPPSKPWEWYAAWQP